jgi:hypothetical protein
MLKIKLLAVFAFLAVAAVAFLFGNNETRAQSGKTGAKRDEVLEKVADYKTWKQVQKPEKEPGEVVTISDSSPAG